MHALCLWEEQWADDVQASVWLCECYGDKNTQTKQRAAAQGFYVSLTNPDASLGWGQSG